jgi:DNA-3-methyladenine glycosylase
MYRGFFNCRVERQAVGAPRALQGRYPRSQDLDPSHVHTLGERSLTSTRLPIPSSPGAERWTPLAREFYARDALVVARELVGAYVVAARGGTVRAVRIVETEAYRGPSDAACHARAGLTRRTRSLLGAPGHAYVFLVYGMHECFNVVCLREGSGHAVLIRAGEAEAGIDRRVRTDGPGRVARALGVTRADDGKDLTGAALFVSARLAKVRTARGPRVGVAYAGAVAEKPWRFYDAVSRYVSRPPKSAIGLGRA